MSYGRRLYADASAVATPVMRISEEEQERKLIEEIESIDVKFADFMKPYSNIRTLEGVSELHKEFDKYMTNNKISKDAVWPSGLSAYGDGSVCTASRIHVGVGDVRTAMWNYKQMKKYELSRLQEGRRLREQQRRQKEQALAASVRISNTLLDEAKAPEPDLLQFSRVQELEGLFTPSP